MSTANSVQWVRRGSLSATLHFTSRPLWPRPIIMTAVCAPDGLSLRHLETARWLRLSSLAACILTRRKERTLDSPSVKGWCCITWRTERTGGPVVPWARRKGGFLPATWPRFHSRYEWWVHEGREEKSVAQHVRANRRCTCRDGR